MILKRRLSWVQLLFSVRGSSVARTYPWVLAITAFSVIVTVIEHHFQIETYSLTLAPFMLIGVALGIFLGFRNDAAYDRYWEARRLWGDLVNVTRSYARQITTLLVHNDDRQRLESFQRDIVYMIIAYVHAFRHLLRDTDPRLQIEELLAEEDYARLASQQNLPLFILRRIGERVRWAWQEGWIDNIHMVILEGTLTRLTDIQGSCERIKNTPIPFLYTVLIHRIVFVYCFALPFGIYETVGVLTPVVVLIVTYAFLGLDDIGDEIEDPFGIEPQHLPLTALSVTIEVNLRQHLDETELPEIPQPVDDVLL